MPRRDMLSPLTSPNGSEVALRGFVRGVNGFLRGPARFTTSQVVTPRRRRLYGIIVQPEPEGEGGPWFGGWMGEWV